MKAKVIRSYIDKNTMQEVVKDSEIEVTEERFLELTEGPKGVFVVSVETEPEGSPEVEIKLEAEVEPEAEVEKEEVTKKATKKK